jgi:hypothetical protein
MNVEEKLLFNNEAIRDTDSHDSAITDIRWGHTKTMIFENSLNQEVTVSIYGSRSADMSNSFLRASFPLSSATNMVQDCGCYFPYLQIKTSCVVAPTSGTVTIAIYTLGD